MARRTLKREALSSARVLGALLTSPRSTLRMLSEERLLRRNLADSGQSDFVRGSSAYVRVDHDEPAGEIGGHYFWQDLVVAQEIFRRAPRRHIDVGSRLAGFVSHVASYRTIETIDLRPLTVTVPGVIFRQGDLLDLAHSEELRTDSLSCLHTLEHIGLGRYGDRINANGWKEGLDACVTMLDDGGTLYVSVPCGFEQRVEFNSQRVFSVPYFSRALEESCLIEQFHFVDDDGNLQLDIDASSAIAQRSFGARYGLGIWVARKR